MLKQLASIALLLIVSAAVSLAQQTPLSPQVTVIRAGRLVDVDAGRVLTSQMLLLRGGKIEAMGENLSVPAGATVIDSPLARTLSDAISFLAGWQTTFDSPKEDGTCDNRHQTRRLCIRKPEKRSRVDADKFNQESGHTRQDKVAAEDFSVGPDATHCFLSHLPQKRRDRQPDEKLIEWRRMHALRRRHDAVGETHAPGQRRWHAVITVTRQQAANAPDGVTNRRRRRA